MSALDYDCGGCAGIGSHKRWCKAEHGHAAHRLGRQSAKAEALADEVGSNHPEAANALYRAAGLLTEKARAKSSAHRAREATP